MNFWDLKNVVGRKHFSKKENCTSYAEVELLATEDDFLLVWARKALKISIRLYDANNGNTLWTAKHRAGRTGGSVPLSILSAGVSIARAMRVSEDSDIYESIIDDAVRRMAKTLPSAKKHQNRYSSRIPIIQRSDNREFRNLSTGYSRV